MKKQDYHNVQQHNEQGANENAKQVAITKETIRTSPPWDKQRLIKPGTICNVIPADNLPPESLIKYWIKPRKGQRVDWAIDANGPYGIGARATDIEIISCDYS